MSASTPTRIGPYEVVGQLGQGGMGAVFRVRHPTLETERALKLLLKPTPKQTVRFERELLRLAQVRHPNVVGIHDTGVAADGRPYFVMDLLEGRTLDRALEEDGTPELEQGLEWAIAICAGVQALHEQGVVHRDLKPQNILLTRDGRPVVLDVGLAVDPERDERLTRTGALVGTLYYMAPEQFGKGEPTPRTDVFALGLIVFELLTGTPAVPRSSSAEVAARILNQDRPVPGSVDGSLPLALDRVSARATDRAPDQRYADAGKLAQALREVLEQPGLSRRTVRGLQGVIALLALTLLAAIAVRWRGASTATEGAPSPTAQPGGARDADVSRLRRLPTAEERAKAAAEWLAERPDPNHPGRAEVETIRARALAQWGRARLKGLRSLKDPTATYLAVRDWYETFGREHKNAGAVHEVLARVARSSPIKRFEPVWFVTFHSSTQLLSANQQGLRRWDRATLDPVGEPVALGAWACQPNPERTGLFVAERRDRRQVSWYDLKAESSRPSWRLPFSLLWTAFAPSGKVVALRGQARFELRSFPEGQRLYGHAAPARITSVQPDDHGHVAITYWGTLNHPVRPPPVVDVRRVSDDRLLKRHKLVGSGMALALAPDGRTLGCVTSLGRVYLFDMRDPSKSRTLSGSDVSEPERGIVEAPALKGIGRCVAFSPDGKTIFAAASGQDLRSGEVRGWDVASGRQVFMQRRPHSVKRVEISPDGRWLLLTCDGQPFELWLWQT